jgi:hypothetical protein
MADGQEGASASSRLRGGEVTYRFCSGAGDRNFVRHPKHFLGQDVGR